jgi:H+-translocating NAD(P) transhydrogenase subunit alpha
MLSMKSLGWAMLGFLIATTGANASDGMGGAVDPAIYRLMVFAMAIFVGYYVVWSVTPALHTPLMAVIVVGALLACAVDGMMSGSFAARVFGLLALIMASVNIFGGFLVTQRMLAMYTKKASPAKKSEAA